MISPSLLPCVFRWDSTPPGTPPPPRASFKSGIRIHFLGREHARELLHQHAPQAAVLEMVFSEVNHFFARHRDHVVIQKSAEAKRACSARRAMAMSGKNSHQVNRSDKRFRTECRIP